MLTIGTMSLRCITILPPRNFEPTKQIMNCKPRVILCVWALSAGLFFVAPSVLGQTTLFWRSEAENGLWSGGANWWDGTAPTAPLGSDILRIDNNVELLMDNDLGGGAANRFRIFFDGGATQDRTISGSTANTFFDFGGGRPLIQNDSTATHTLIFPVVVGPSFDLEINPVGGGLVLGGTVNIPTGRNVLIFGDNGHNALLSGIISGAGSVRVEQNSVLTLTGENAYTGGTVVANGTLQVAHISESGISNIGTAGGSGNYLALQNGTLSYTGTGAQTSTRTLWIDQAQAGSTFNIASATGALTLNPGSGVINRNITKTGVGSLTLGGSVPITGAASVTVDAGLLVLNRENTNTGSTLVNGGTLRLNGAASRSSASYTIQPGATLEVNGTNVFVSGHGTAMANTRTITANAGTLLFTGSADSRIGNVTLHDGATMTSNRTLLAWDVLLANTTTGAATIAVTGSGASVMNGSGGIHLQGVQNFNVADTTGDANADLTVSMVLAPPGNAGGAAGGLRKQGAGTMVLTGANTYNGETIVEQGVLRLNGSSGRSTSSFTVQAGATLEMNGTNTLVLDHGTPLPASRVITVNGGTLLMTTAMDSRFGNVVLNDGATWTSNRVLTNWDALLANTTAGAATVAVTGVGVSTMNGTGGIHLQGVQNFDVADTTGDASADLIVSMVLDNPGRAGGAAGGVNKQGDGTMSITRTTTYTGGTTVSAGTLSLDGGGGSAGTIRGVVTVADGATLRLGANDVTGFSTGADSLKEIRLEGGTMHVATTGGGGQNQTLGSATVFMTGGHITGALATSNLDFFGGASALTTLESSETSTISGTRINLRQTSVTFTVADGDAALDLEVSSPVYGNSLVKAGPGTMSMSGANTYTGTTIVEEGTLLVHGSHVGGGLITVNPDATLGGGGSIGDVSFLDGAWLSPGASAGSLSVNDLTLSTSSRLRFELGAPNQGIDPGTSDFVAVNGNLVLDGELYLSALPGFGIPQVGDTWVLMTYQPGFFTDNGLNIASDPDGYLFQLDTASIDGQVLLRVVPEPGPFGLLLLGMIALSRIRTRRPTPH
jgi:autotransporter-associated beta strand protein